MHELIAFRDGVRVRIEDGTVTLDRAGVTLALRPVLPGVRAALARLAAGPVPETGLVVDLAPPERAQLAQILRRVGQLVARGVVVDGRELIRLEVTARGAVHRPESVPDGASLRLSRFAFCRSRSDVLVLESPQATARVLLTHPAARGLVAALGSPRTAGDLVTPDLTGPAVAEVLGQLVGAGLVEVADGSGRFASDTDPTLRQWDFHDLLFHSRIRLGRYDDPIGGFYPHAGEIEPLPAVKGPPDGPTVDLYRPTLDGILAADPALTVALESRRSFRRYGEDPMTVRQLGEFLYRVARVRAHRRPGGGQGDEILGLPYPTGGSAYDLELYLTVRRCAGLDPGIYYYDPVGHRLVLVNDDGRAREEMAAVAGRSTGMAVEPDVLITMTSRFQRLSWKYSGIAYAMTLRHTGVLYQTMYLVATAMGLAPCGLGLGDAELSARVLGLDYTRESSVGDFLLGSRRPDDIGDWDLDDGWYTVNDGDWGHRTASIGRAGPALSE